MNILIIEKPLKINTFKPFTPDFDQVMISYEEDILDYYDVKPTKSNISAFFNEALNFSWDGEIYWFAQKDKESVLKILSQWFNDPENHTESDEGISSCILIKHTPNGIAIINTQYDTLGSDFDNFGQYLKAKEPEIDYLYYSDSHLIDHLYLGRETNNNEFDIFLKLYQEGVIDSSFFFNGLDPDEDAYCDLLPKDKPIVITGKFPLSREEITEKLTEIGFNVSDKIQENSWLWMGEKVGDSKMKKAQSKGTFCSTESEIIAMAYENYQKNNA